MGTGEFQLTLHTDFVPSTVVKERYLLDSEVFCGRLRLIALESLCWNDFGLIEIMALQPEQDYLSAPTKGNGQLHRLVAMIVCLCN
jgi:hypothetical protein